MRSIYSIWLDAIHCVHIGIFQSQLNSFNDIQTYSVSKWAIDRTFEKNNKNRARSKKKKNNENKGFLLEFHL